MVDRHCISQGDREHCDELPATSVELPAPSDEASPPAVSDDDTDSDAWSGSDSGDGDGDAHLADDAAPDAGAGLVPFGLQQGLAASNGQMSPAPTFGNVAVTNSTDIQFGNKTFFNGPVTIKQVVYAKDVEGAVATAVPAAATGASVAHVDPDAPDKSGVLAEGVEVKVLDPVVLANGGLGRRTTPANGVGSSASSESVSETNCCEIPGFPAASKPGHELAAEKSWWRRIWEHPGQRNMLLLGIAVLLVLCGLVMSISSSYTSRYYSSWGRSEPELPKPWVNTDTNVTLSGKLRIIPRREWLAQPRREQEFLKLPVPYVIISHSASEGCTTQAACVQMVRYIQTFHIESRGWSDIAYNFLVGGDGYVYEGRGWEVIGAHTFGYNNRSIGLNMVGTFIYALPSEAQLTALRQLIQLGVEKGYIAENYKLLAHRQLSATESPGKMFYEELKKWPHWSSKP